MIKELANIIGDKPHAQDDARQILMYVTGRTHADLIAHPNKSIGPLRTNKARRLARQRSMGKPMAYILGYREFYGRRFSVTKDTLVPRPETELMIEEALKHTDCSDQIIDVGTGSGAIAITLAAETGRHILATDVSKKALRVARNNASNNKVSHLVHFGVSDLISEVPVTSTGDGGLLILANLPYLSTDMLSESPKEVKDYEPTQALVSDSKDGLELYRKLLGQLKDVRAGSITTMFEIDPRQEGLIEPMVLEYFEDASIEIQKDLALKPRLVVLKLK